jgi:hypothetical protein
MKKFPKIITELSHQRYMHYSQKSSIQCPVRKNAPEGRKCPRDIVTRGTTPRYMASAKEYIDEALSIAMHVIRAAIHSILGSSLESLTFNRDMFLNIPLIANWHTITQRQEHQLMKIS